MISKCVPSARFEAREKRATLYTYSEVDTLVLN